MTDTHGPENESWFTEYLDEVSGPFVVVVGRYEYTFEAPPPEIGPALDDEVSLFDVLDILTGDDEVADELTEHFEDKPVSALQALVDDVLEHWGLVDPPPQGFARVCSELDRYGPAIEYDLREVLHLDLDEFVRGTRTWAALLRFVDRLPVGGHYSAAIASDVELAMARADAKDQAKKDGRATPEPRPSLVGWTPTVSKLNALLSEQRRTTHAVWGSSPKFKGKGGKAPRGLPVPLVADDIVKTRRLRVEHDEVAGAMLGKRYTAK